jgi:hypothetical protein
MSTEIQPVIKVDAPVAVRTAGGHICAGSVSNWALTHNSAELIRNLKLMAASHPDGHVVRNAEISLEKHESAHREACAAQFIAEHGEAALAFYIKIVDAGYKALAEKHYPDHGGSHEDMAALNAAKKLLDRPVTQ